MKTHFHNCFGRKPACSSGELWIFDGVKKLLAQQWFTVYGTLCSFWSPLWEKVYAEKNLKQSLMISIFQYLNFPVSLENEGRIKEIE